MRRAAASLAAALMLPLAATAQAPSAPAQSPGGPAAAAQGPDAPPPASPILTIDQDALYRESAWGRRAQAELEARSKAIAAENDRIAAELEAEDDALTELRPTLPPEEFQRRAEAFDARVQQTRRDRDLAGRELLAEADADRAAFLRAVLPVFGAMMAERGALVILDRRTVFLSADAVDITEDMIARIDATVGDRPAEADGAAAGIETPPDTAPSADAPPSAGASAGAAGNGLPSLAPEVPADQAAD